MNQVHTAHSVRGVMLPLPPCVAPSVTLRQLIDVFRQGSVSHALVVNRHAALLGSIAARDVLTAARDLPAQWAGERETVMCKVADALFCAADFLKPCPVIVSAGTPLDQAAEFLRERGGDPAIVVDAHGAPIGLVTELELTGISPAYRPAEAVLV
ncbi:MAG: CBS domain-containing protein [Phycisphaerales bacterium]|nr:CBS domain-containing protein [Phycisphaerales bacterium]